MSFIYPRQGIVISHKSKLNSSLGDRRTPYLFMSIYDIAVAMDKSILYAQKMIGDFFFILLNFPVLQIFTCN